MLYTWGRHLVFLLLFVNPATAAPTCYNSPDPPYQLNERWCKDGSTWWVTGRTELPLSKKLNLLWWFGNDYEPVAPTWYMPGKPSWQRNALWYARNPLQNGGNYVFGVKDLNYTVHFYKAPPGVTNFADTGGKGCLYTVLDNARGGNLWFPRAYMSCTNRAVTWYAGTQWSGFFGFKFNIMNGAVQLF